MKVMLSGSDYKKEKALITLLTGLALACGRKESHLPVMVNDEVLQFTRLPDGFQIHWGGFKALEYHNGKVTFAKPIYGDSDDVKIVFIVEAFELGKHQSFDFFSAEAEASMDAAFDASFNFKPLHDRGNETEGLYWMSNTETILYDECLMPKKIKFISSSRVQVPSNESMDKAELMLANYISPKLANDTDGSVRMSLDHVNGAFYDLHAEAIKKVCEDILKRGEKRAGESYELLINFHHGYQSYFERSHARYEAREKFKGLVQKEGLLAMEIFVHNLQLAKKFNFNKNKISYAVQKAMKMQKLSDEYAVAINISQK